MSRTRAASDVCHFLKLLKLNTEACAGVETEITVTATDGSEGGGVFSSRRWRRM